METADFFRVRIDAMLNLSDPLAVLATRLAWDQIEASVAAKFERQPDAPKAVSDLMMWLERAERIRTQQLFEPASNEVRDRKMNFAG